MRSFYPLQFQTPEERLTYLAAKPEPKKRNPKLTPKKTHLYCQHFKAQGQDYGFDDGNGDIYHLCQDCSRKALDVLGLKESLDENQLAPAFDYEEWAA